MRKLVKRSLVALALIMFVLALVALGAGVLYKGTPDWYVPNTATREQMLTAATGAENKLTATQNWAARLNAVQIRANLTSATNPTTQAADTHVITFTDVELNALFDKWSTVYGWSSKYDQFLADPRIILQKDRLILAGRMKDLGAIASVHFQPALDPETGKLRLEIVRLLGGRLPLPETLFNSQRRKILDSLARNTPNWQRRANIDPAGAANQPAMFVALGRLAAHALQHEPADPILFLPLAQQNKSVPVQVTAVSIDDGSLSLTVRALSSQERASLLTRIKTSDSTLAAGR